MLTPFSRADYEDYHIHTHALQQLREMFLHNITLTEMRKLAIEMVNEHKVSGFGARKDSAPNS